MLSWRALRSTEIGMEQTLRVNETQACKSIFHQTTMISMQKGEKLPVNVTSNYRRHD